MRGSWVDALLDFVDRFPGPAWLFWICYVTVFGLLGHAVRWLTGDLPVSEFSPVAAAEGSYPAAFLWSLGLLNRVARRALGSLRPAIRGDGREVAQIEHELLHTPARWANAALLVGFAAGPVSVSANPAGYGLGADSDPILIGLVALDSALSMVALLAFIVHAGLQLRVVERVHRSLVTVDLFRLGPLYAFASLTAWTGITLIGCAAFGLGVLAITAGTYLSFSTIDLVTIGAIPAVATILFVVPLVGLHGLIQDEKDRRLGEAMATLAATLAEVQRRVAAGEIEAAGRLNDAVAAANATVAAVARTSTWPWRAETLRGFVSAVLLPVVLWLLFQGLGRVFPG